MGWRTRERDVGYRRGGLEGGGEHENVRKVENITREHCWVGRKAKEKEGEGGGETVKERKKGKRMRYWEDYHTV